MSMWFKLPAVTNVSTSFSTLPHVDHETSIKLISWIACNQQLTVYFAPFCSKQQPDVLLQSYFLTQFLLFKMLDLLLCDMLHV